MSPIQQYLNISRERMAREDFAGALAQAEAALELDAASIDALQLRGRALYYLRREAEAVDALRRVHAVLAQEITADEDTPVTRDPFAEMTLSERFGLDADLLEILRALRKHQAFDGELLHLMAELAIDAGQFALARELYDELVRDDPSRMASWEGLLNLLVQEDLDAAREALDQALRLFPTQPLLYEYLGFIHYHRYQYHDAVTAYHQAITLGGDRSENYQALAQALLALHEDDAVLKTLQLLLHRWPQAVETQQFVVEVALEIGQIDAARAATRQLFRQEPTHADTYRYLALTEIADDNWDAAEHALRLGFHKALDGAGALFALVEQLIELNEPEDALRVAELARAWAPEHPESAAARGKVLRELGAFSEALESFRIAARLAPADETYQTWQGVVLDNLGEYEEAMAVFDAILDRQPRDGWTLCNRGLTGLTLGRANQALADFSRCIEIDPYDATAFFWRACALVKLGKMSDALWNLSHALDMDEELHEWLEDEQMLDPLRHDARFRKLLRQFPQGDLE